jgi:hypothetical protein
MKKLLVALLFLSACATEVPKVELTPAPDSIKMVRIDTAIAVNDTTFVPKLIHAWLGFQELDGSYPREVGLLERKPLQKRLHDLLGKTLPVFSEHFQVTPPIEIQDGLLFVEGCKQHFCNIDESAMVIDMYNDILYVAIALNKKVTFFSESDVQPIPKKLLHWRTKFNQP